MFNLVNTHRLSLMFLFAILTGCTATPTIELNRIGNPDQVKGDEIDSFFLRESLIKISKPTTDGDFLVSSIPAEHTDFKLGVRRADSAGVKTNLNISKIANTELIHEAGIEVSDKRVELIQKVGAIVTSLLPIALRPGELVVKELPIVINTEILLSNPISREARNDINAGKGVTISFGPVPPDARETSQFISPTRLSGLIYSACRTATVSFTMKQKKFEHRVKVSDPNYYQTVAFPQKGKVAFHSECGVSVSSEKDTGVSTTADIVEALVAQGKAIKEAIEAAKNSGNGGAEGQAE